MHNFVAQLCCRISLHSLISWKPKERTWHALPPAPAATPCLALFGQIWIPAISFASQPCHGHHVMIVSRSLDTDRHFGWPGVSSLAWAHSQGIVSWDGSRVHIETQQMCTYYADCWISVSPRALDLLLTHGLLKTPLASPVSTCPLLPLSPLAPPYVFYRLDNIALKILWLE